MNRPSLVLAPPLSLKALLDGALRLLRLHLRSLYLPFAVPLILMAGALTIFQVVASYPVGGRATPGSQFVATIIGVLASVLLYSLVFLAMNVTAIDVVHERPISLRRSWRRVVDPRFLATQLLAWIMILFGLVFCILPGIYAGLVVTLVVPVMTQESRFGMAAIRRSMRLMSHNPRREWSVDPRARSFLISFAGGLISYATSFIVSLPVAALMMIFMFRAAAQGRQADPEAMMRQMMWIQVPSNMLGMLVQTLVFLYLAFGVALLYTDVLKRKEGGDLLAAAERLAHGAPPSE